MADWEREIEIELQRAGGSANPGRLRTAARRIAGIAVQQMQNQENPLVGAHDYMSALRLFINSGNIPPEVSAAAERLESRLSADFTSQSVDPIGDAMLIVEYVRSRLRKNGKEKNGHQIPD